MKALTSIFSICIVGLVLLGSCKKAEDPVDYVEVDEKIIQDYIAANNLDADSTSSGLYYVMETIGTGKSPSQYSDIQIKYKGYLTNGTVFDESTDGIRINLSSVISGWEEGVQLFKEGGEGILLIPSRLGYGNQEAGDIPANSVLIFEIKLEEVYQ